MKNLTPAQRHQQRIRAAQAAASPETAQDMAGATQYELHLMQLKQDQLRLKQIRSIDARNTLKPELLTAYDAYIDGVLQGGQGQQDEVLTTVMLWHLDTGNWQRGLQIAAYVLQHGVNLPDRFERNPATLVAEEVANAALTEFRADGGFDRAVLEHTYQLTAEHDMPDQVRAKLHFALGLAQEPAEDSAIEALEQAKSHMAEAIRLHERVGAKKDLERIERWLKKHAEGTAKAEAKPEPQQATDEAEASEATS